MICDTKKMKSSVGTILLNLKSESPDKIIFYYIGQRLYSIILQP